jgi:transcriptional regulator with XRE-family HTH domain
LRALDSISYAQQYADYHIFSTEYSKYTYYRAKSVANYAKSLAKVIRENLDGRTQQWLSERTGIKQSAISRLLSGDNLPSLETLMALARGLDIEPNDLLLPVFQPDRDVMREKALREMAFPANDAPGPSMALSPSAIPAPLASDVVAVASQILSISPRRRAIVLAWLFDDTSLLPEDDSAQLDLLLLSAAKKP